MSETPETIAQTAASLLTVGLQQRLLSSVEAFARSLKVHRATVERQWAQQAAAAAAAGEVPTLFTSTPDADDERGQWTGAEQEAAEAAEVEAVTAASEAEAPRSAHGHGSVLNWRAFVHGGSSACSGQLWLDELGTSGDLGDLMVRCTCGKKRSMIEASNRELKPLGLCSGRRPWLGPESVVSPPTSDADTRVLQRLLAAPEPGPAPPPVPAAPGLSADDEIYLRVWAIEQEHGKTIWTVVTFFLSISFAIFGFSFQAQLASPMPSVIRVSAVFIYWFGILLFLRFHHYNRVLRQYLRDRERQGQTSVSVHARYDAVVRAPSRLPMGARPLLIYFGLFHSAGVLLLLWLFP